MIEFNYLQLQEWVAQFLYPFFRITSFMLAAPIFGHKKIPTSAKITFAMSLSILMMYDMPAVPDISLASWAGYALIIEQILVGLVMGFTLKIIFAAILSAGEFISLQMGLGFATFFSPDSNSNTLVLSRILNMIALLLFLALGLHLVVLEGLNKSFEIVPIGTLGTELQPLMTLAKFAKLIFVSGMMLALPVVAPLLIINMTLGILNRSVPQFTVFSIGFPLSMLVGFFFMIILTTTMDGYLIDLFTTGTDMMTDILEDF